MIAKLQADLEKAQAGRKEAEKLRGQVEALEAERDELQQELEGYGQLENESLETACIDVACRSVGVSGTFVMHVLPWCIYCTICKEHQHGCFGILST